MDNNLANIDVRHFRLINGENVICLVKGYDDDFYYVEEPFTILDYDGAFTANRWFRLSDQTTFKLTKQTIVSFAQVRDEIKENFIRLIQESREVVTSEPDTLDDTFDDTFEDDTIVPIQLSDKIH